MKKILSLVLSFMVCPVLLFAQQPSDPNIGVTKVMPVSPNAASLGKFGDIPVSNFTGLPNIDIPFFSFGTGSLKSKVSLSYHASGLKVSDVASWVGTGWNLNAGGAISRSVRGMADNPSFIDPPMTVKFLADHMYDPAYELAVRYKMIDAGKGQFDTEPDIFFFNFDNYSGKFFFNQQTGKFHTISKSNLVITYHNNSGSTSFKIKADNGNTYYFAQEEYTNARTTCNVGGPDNPSYSVSSWYLTKVENNNNTDLIEYEYNNSAYSSFKTANSSTSYWETSRSGSAWTTNPAPQDQTCNTEIAITSKKLSKIKFREGYIQFTTNTSRCDLIGEKALDKMELFNYDGELKKRVVFQYGYFGGSDQPAVCNDEVQAALLRLKLKSVREEAVTGGVTIQQEPYVFAYENEGDVFPSRTSFAQDYWGYYNGITYNTSLIPDVVRNSTVVLPSGNNRKPDPAYTKYGALKKITYPTNGTTEFFFENNQVLGSYLPPEPGVRAEYLNGDQVGTQTYYEKEFTVNEPSGGTYVNLYFDFLGCEVIYDDYYDYPGLRCADLRIIGLTPGTLTKDISPNYTAGISHPNAEYLPNGTYKMMASFIQSGVDFKNFIFEILWRTPAIPPTTPQPAVAGGLRIQKMVDFDGIDHARDKIKKFEYLTPEGLCSGSFIGPWSNSFDNPFTTSYNSAKVVTPQGDIVRMTQTINYLKRESTGNYPLLTSSGSYTGYKYVTVSDGESNVNGTTRYKYSFTQDEVTPVFPYPYLLLDWTKGQIEEEKVFKKEGTSLLEVKATANNISSSSIFDPVETNGQIGLKVGFLQSVIFEPGGGGGVGSPAGGWDFVFGLDSIAKTEVPVYAPYYTISGWSKLNESIITNYAGSATLNEKTQLTYNNANYQPSLVETFNSKGGSLITKTIYTIDYTAPVLPAWLQNLKDKNLVALPVERITIRKDANGVQSVIKGFITTYKAGQTVVDEVYALEITEPVPLANFTMSTVTAGVLNMDSRYKKKVTFGAYDAFGNIQEQQKADDIKLAYVWEYKSNYPVAEVTNAAVKDIFYSSFENTEGNSSDGDGKTGRKSRVGGYSKALTNLTDGKYILSYWQKSGSTWALQSSEVVVTGNAYTISLSGQVDELRFYPSDAQMTSSTYDPLVGITSMTDVKNQITFYEYDGFNRLKLIRDQDGKILKQFDYQYKAPVTQ